VYLEGLLGFCVVCFFFLFLFVCLFVPVPLFLATVVAAAHNLHLPGGDSSPVQVQPAQTPALVISTWTSTWSESGTWIF
jgi:uncharacterized SAM-binding protein YcdF (DUF218 family)